MSDSKQILGKNAEVSRAVKLAMATTLMSLAGTVGAQDGGSAASPDDSEAVEEVVVTGFRASLDKALDAKQNQVGAIDMIVAEDIADFPDRTSLNAAARAGRGDRPATPAKAARSRCAVSTAIYARAHQQRRGHERQTAPTPPRHQPRRSFDFNTFSSELFSNIIVRKTATAETEEGSLGATIDLRAPAGLRRFHHGWFGADGLQRSERRLRSARRVPDQQYLRRWQVRRAVLRRVHQSQAG
jgi:hypothetical protein